MQQSRNQSPLSSTRQLETSSAEQRTFGLYLRRYKPAGTVGRPGKIWLRLSDDACDVHPCQSGVPSRCCYSKSSTPQTKVRRDSKNRGRSARYLRVISEQRLIFRRRAMMKRRIDPSGQFKLANVAIRPGDYRKNRRSPTITAHSSKNTAIAVQVGLGT